MISDNIFIKTAHLIAFYNNLLKSELFKSQLPIAWDTHIGNKKDTLLLKWITKTIIIDIRPHHCFHFKKKLIEADRHCDKQSQ